MRWNIVKQPVIQGGLGVIDLRFFNEALLRKWLCRFMNEKGNLWRKVVQPNVVRQVSVGFLPFLVVLMGIASGDTFEKDGQNSLPPLPLT